MHKLLLMLLTAALLTTTASAAASAAPVRPTVTMIKAFDHDLPTSAAVAARAKTVPRWICTVYAGDPQKNRLHGHADITGDGSQFCSGLNYYDTRVTVRIQQYRGLGFWEQKGRTGDTGWHKRSFLYEFATWICGKGSGTQTYRLVVTGYAESGRYSEAVQSSNYLRTTCPN